MARPIPRKYKTPEEFKEKQRLWDKHYRDRTKGQYKNLAIKLKADKAQHVQQVAKEQGTNVSEIFAKAIDAFLEEAGQPWQEP